MKDLSLVVVDAVSPEIEENDDVALDNIQALADSGIATKVYEFGGIQRNSLRHDSRKIMAAKEEEEAIKELTGEIILTGGRLGCRLYDVFEALLKQRKAENGIAVHMPMDCIYTAILRYDSGDNWKEGELADIGSKAFDSYKEAMQKYGPSAYIINVNGKQTERKGPECTLNLWSGWRIMAEGMSGAGR